MKRMIFLAVLSQYCTSTSLFASKLVHTGFDLDRTMGIVFNVDGEEYVAGAGIGLVRINDAEPIESICVNLFEGFSFYEEYWADSMAATEYDPNGGAAGWILQAFLPGASTAIEGAALQLAIWDAIHDGGDGFAAGHIQSNIYTDSAVLELAAGWVAKSAGQNGPRAYVYAPTAGTAAFQQQLYLGSPDGTSDVPEPGTMALLSVGITGLAVAARRRRGD